MSLSQEAKNKIDNLVIAIKSLITEHYNITGSSSKKGHTQAGGVPQTIGTSLSAGTDNGYYARADHIHTVSYDKISGKPNLDNYYNKNTDVIPNEQIEINQAYINNIGISAFENYENGNLRFGQLFYNYDMDLTLYNDNIDSTAEIATVGYVDNNIPEASSDTPLADTISGSVGNSVTWARSNHVHPKSSLYADASHTHTKNQISDFPTTMPPTVHDHDDRYYTEIEINNLLKEKDNKIIIITPKAWQNNDSIKIKAIPMENNLIIVHQQVKFFNYN